MWLVAAAVLPLAVAALLLLRGRDRRRRLARLGQPETIQRILPRQRERRRVCGSLS